MTISLGNYFKIILCLICTLTNSSTGKRKCPTFINYIQKKHEIDFPEERYNLQCSDNNTQCLLYVYQEKSFWDAHKICKQLTGDLWVPETDVIIHYDYWIGIYKLLTSDDIDEPVWMTMTHHILNKENWVTDSLIFQDSMNCAVAKAMKSGKWYPTACRRRFFFVCHFKF
uniref:C-type lectin domain-containing protein n=1 Tax=Trichobilharzia regenti TaxID=157069 RepID=A0AA85IUT0_TRIRE|nr:unnamed protein product [Trichobilharzia regenti]